MTENKANEFEFHCNECALIDIPLITASLAITLSILVLNDKQNKNVAIATLVFSILSIIHRFFTFCYTCKKTKPENVTTDV